jgi:DNA-binding CsgD family transcriptional regulator
MPAGPVGNHVYLRVSELTLARVLRIAIVSEGFLVADEPVEFGVLVTDDLHRDDRVLYARVIEVAAPFARTAARVVHNVRTVRSHAVVLADEPHVVGPALSACVRGGVFISDRALAMGNSFPALSARHDQVLGLIAQGEWTQSIWRKLNLSEASVKRDIHALEQQLGVYGRADLAAKAMALGFPPRRVD